MKYIAHRGLFDGPNRKLENKPEQIENSLSKGYDCEVDLWRIWNEWWLGHDEPQYKVNEDFIKKPGLWLHCKNLNALYELSISKHEYVYFWHQNDDFTLTSNQYIWTYPNKDLSNNSIAVMPECSESYWNYIKNITIFGVCTDYVEKFIAETSSMSVRSA